MKTSLIPLAALLLLAPVASAAPDLPDLDDAPDTTRVGPCAVTTGTYWPGTIAAVGCSVNGQEVVFVGYGWKSLGWSCPVRAAGLVSVNACDAIW